MALHINSRVQALSMLSFRLIVVDDVVGSVVLGVLVDFSSGFCILLWILDVISEVLDVSFVEVNDEYMLENIVVGVKFDVVADVEANFFMDREIGGVFNLKACDEFEGAEFANT